MWTPDTRPEFAMPEPDPRDEEARSRLTQVDLEADERRNRGRARLTTGSLSQCFGRRARDAEDELDDFLQQH